MNPSTTSVQRLRVCAVSFLNTAPLVWGLLHGRQRDLFDLSFAVPSLCADRLAAGAADVGLVPVIEAVRLGLDLLPDCGIACRGAVRSILLISKVPFDRISSVAADSNSRTSVALARIVLARRYGVTPPLVSHPPMLDRMLAAADAALVIGDAALHLDPARLPHRVLDLGVEWWELTGLPMVFAQWSARQGCASQELVDAFCDSLGFGREHLDDLVRHEAQRRGFPEPFVREYFERNVVFDLGEAEQQGREAFLAAAREFGMLETSGA